jgi:8-oxo-dGTP diphosphatase
MEKMDLIKEIQEQDVNPGAPAIDDSGFRKREAARAVVFDSEGKVALLHVGLHKYHKLPGGGVDEGEDIPAALERELMEEIGCKAEVTAEVGSTIEHRNKFEMVQTSYCFVANQVGEKGQPDFTAKELREQFAIVWADDIDHAIALLEADDTDDYEGKFITIRDTALLKKAKELKAL